MLRLQELSIRLLDAPDFETVLTEVLDASMALLGTDLGTTQLYNPESHTLELVAQRGFGQEFVDYYAVVGSDHASACALAMESAEQVIVESTADDPRLKNDWPILLPAGSRAVVTTPFITRSGDLLGMVSTHFRAKHRPSEEDLTALDLYIRHATLVMERVRAEAALRANEERLQLALSTARLGTWECDLESGELIDSAQLKANFGRGPDESFDFADFVAAVHVGDRERVLAALAALVEGGEEYHQEYRCFWPDGTCHWVEARGRIIRSGPGLRARLHGVTTDITDRKAGELRESYLSALSAALGQLTDPAEVRDAAARMLGEYLGASRVHYAEISPDGRYSIVESGYTADGVPPVASAFLLEDFGTEIIDRLRANEVIVVHDLARESHLSDKQRAAYAALSIAAEVGLPLVKDGRLAALIAVHQSRPRTWSDDDITVIRETGDRTWTAMVRAQAESALVGSEARYRSLFNSMDEGFAVVDMLFDESGKPWDYRFIEVNPAFAGLTGLVDATGKTARELLPNLEQRWYDLYGRVALTGESTRFVGGSEAMGRWFDVNAFRVGGNESRRVAILFNNITERKQAEMDLRASEQRTALALEIAELGTWNWDPAGSEVVADARCRAIWGFEPHTPITIDRALERVHPEDRERVTSGRARALRPEGSGQYAEEVRWVHPDGSIRWAASRGQTVFEETSGGRRACLMLGTVLDITERKQTEEELRHASRLKDELLGMVSHEFRTPLTTITGNIDVLTRRFDRLSDKDRDESFQELRRDAARLNRLIQNMLVIARGENATDAAAEPLLLQRVLPSFVAEAQRHDTSRPIIADIPDDLPTVLASYGSLDQILENLITNSRKYGAPGTPIELSARVDGSSVAICVADSGKALSADEVGRFLEAFYRGESVRGQSGGVGLGLAVCGLLAQLFGGHLSAAPRRGGGLEVTLTVPIVGD